MTAPPLAFGNQCRKSGLSKEEEAKVLHRLTCLSLRVGRPGRCRACVQVGSGNITLNDKRCTTSSLSDNVSVVPGCQNRVTYSTVGLTTVMQNLIRWGTETPARLKTRRKYRLLFALAVMMLMCSSHFSELWSVMPRRLTLSTKGTN